MIKSILGFVDQPERAAKSQTISRMFNGAFRRFSSTQVDRPMSNSSEGH